MASEEWIVQARLAGEFFITDEHRESTAPLVEGLRSLSITPQFGKDGKYTGLHEFEATLAIDNQGDGPLDAGAVYGQATRLVESVADLASLSIGRPVRVDGGVSAKHRIGDAPPRYRFITGTVDAISIGPPAPLLADVLAINLEQRLQRVIRWWSRGVAARDAVDRIVALSGALDLLAGTMEGAPGRTRRCEKCGYEQAIGPGLRERVVHFLTCELHYDEDQANEIYESRLDVAHARSDLREKDMRRFRTHAEMLATAVRVGLAARLGIELPPVPEALPADIENALLDVEYTDEPKEE